MAAKFWRIGSTSRAKNGYLSTFKRILAEIQENSPIQCAKISPVARKTAPANMTELDFPPFSKKVTPLTVTQIAEITGFHPRTISRKARMGQIPGAFQIGGKGDGWRFKRKPFEDWWARQGGGN